MPEDQKVMEVLIRTKAELAGAVSLRDSLEASIGRAKALGNLEEVKKLSTQLDTVKTSINAATEASSELAQSEKESGEAAEFLHKNHRQLHTLLRMVPGAAGEAGESLLAMAHGPVGPLLGLALAIGIVSKTLDDVEAQRLPDLTDGIDQANNYAIAWNGIAKAIDDVRAAYNSSEEVHSRSLVAISAELKAQLAYIQAVKERALAELNVQRAAGMDQGEYDRKKGIIENGASDQEAQAEINARNAKLAADKRESDKATAEAMEAKRKADAYKAPETEKQLEADKAALKIVEDAARKKQEAAEQRVAQIQDLQTDRSSGVNNTYGGQLMKVLEGWREMWRSGASENSKIETSPSGLAANAKTEAAAAKDAKDKADAAAAEQDRLDKAFKEKQRLQNEADDKAKKAEELKLKIAPEFAPNAANTPGTVAYENAQQAARQKDKDTSGKINSDATAFGADQKKVDEDSKWLNSHAPTQQNVGEYRAKINELTAAVTEMAAIISDLAGLGADTKKMATVLVNVQKDVAAARQVADQALAHANLH